MTRPSTQAQEERSALVLGLGMPALVHANADAHLKPSSTWRLRTRGYGPAAAPG